MKETKYRAWDKQGKPDGIDSVSKGRMLYGDDLPGAHCCGGHMTINDILRDEGYVYLEYTGLHDKNGEELWQGDIYTDSNWPRKPLVVEWVDDLYDDNGSNYSGWSVAIPEDGIDESIYGPTKIGNIYENPELQEAT